MKLDLGFADSIEYRKEQKTSVSTHRTYYVHYIIVRGSFPTFTLSIPTFLAFDLIVAKEEKNGN